MNDPFFEQLVLQLRVISKIKQSQKLSVSGNELDVTDTTHFDSIKRWFYSESRDKTYERIREVVDIMSFYIHDRMDKRDCMILAQKEIPIQAQRIQFKTQMFTIMDNLSILYELIDPFLQGISNLELTYYKDPLFHAKLERIIEKCSSLKKEIEMYTGKKDKSTDNKVNRELEERNKNKNK